MRLWGTVRRETGGLVRSIGYDLRQRVDSVWSRADAAYPEYDAYARRPRRTKLVGGLAALALVGVAGTYMALAGGLGTWLLGNNAAPGPGGAPDVGTVTPAAHGPAPQPSEGRRPAPTPTGSRKSGGEGRGAPEPSTSAHSATGEPTDRPPHPPGIPQASPSPSPAPSPTPSPAPTPSDTPSPTPPEPSPTADGSPPPDTTPVELSLARSTIVPTGI